MNRFAKAAALGVGATACGASHPIAEISPPPPGAVIPSELPVTSLPGGPGVSGAAPGSVDPGAAPTTEPAPTTSAVTSPPNRPAVTVEPFTAWPPEVEDDPMGNDAYRARILACIRSYEQGAAGYATETGNGYSGAYQFDPPTWYGAVLGAVEAGMLGPEDARYADGPADEAPARVQDAAAWWLYLQRGFGPWPTPQARCAS